MPVRVIDANAHLRQKLERDTSGLTLRTIAAEARVTDVFVWDAPGSLTARRAIFPAYKAKRKPAVENIYACLDLMKECLLHTPAIQITVPGYEADDVAATLTRYCVTNGCEVLVETCDRDLKALETLPGVRVTAKPITGVPPERLHLFKTLVGDPSDNVPGVPGFGPKAWDAEIHPAWEELISELSDGREPLWDHLPIAKRFLEWVKIQENQKILLAMWAVTNLFDVPMDLIDACVVKGRSDRTVLDSLLRGYLQ